MSFLNKLIKKEELTTKDYIFRIMKIILYFVLGIILFLWLGGLLYTILIMLAFGK